MSVRADADTEFWVLTTPEGLALLDAVSAVPTPRPADLTRWRKAAAPEHVAAALRLADGRCRGLAKFSRAAAMWFEPTGLEQATAEAVGRHKAARIAIGACRAVDLCCGIGGDTLALAAAGLEVLAADLDPGMARRTVWNAAAYEAADRVAAVVARAESLARPPDAWVHIDPDRRTAGVRARDVAGYQPGLPFLRSLMGKAAGGAIKLGPASDFNEAFGADAVEVELVSLGGECKEATVWFGQAVGCRRRATCLPNGATWTDRDAPADAQIGVSPVDAWVFDPDPTLLRAGLLDGFAAVHGLSRFAAGVDYLTGPRPVGGPWLTPFRVEGVWPLDLKALRAELRARGVGSLEIKVRGLTLRPEELRPRLKLEGDRSATLVLAGGGGHARAILATRATAD